MSLESHKRGHKTGHKTGLPSAAIGLLAIGSGGSATYEPAHFDAACVAEAQPDNQLARRNNRLTSDRPLVHASHFAVRRQRSEPVSQGGASLHTQSRPGFRMQP